MGSLRFLELFGDGRVVGRSVKLFEGKGEGEFVSVL